MSNMISTNGPDSSDSQILTNLIGTLYNQWNDTTAPKKEEKVEGITSLLYFFSEVMLSLELYDNEPCTLSCQNLLEIVWLRIHVWLSMLFSIKSDGAWLWLQVIILACPLKGCKMGLFRDFPEIVALTADPKQEQSYDCLKTCLNNEVAHRA